MYVDWKAGGQMNFQESLANEWWQRWENTNELRFNNSETSKLGGLGVDYLVLSSSHRLPDLQPVYENRASLVYFLGVPKL